MEIKSILGLDQIYKVSAACSGFGGSKLVRYSGEGNMKTYLEKLQKQTWKSKHVTTHESLLPAFDRGAHKGVKTQDVSA